MHHCLSGGKLAEFYAIVECHLDLMVIFTGILAQYAICVKTQVDLNTICQNNLMGQDNPMDRRSMDHPSFAVLDPFDCIFYF